MAYIKLNNVSVSGIAACVPKNKKNNIDIKRLFANETELTKTINAIGIKEKRISEPDTCASDLCFAAADKLLNELDISRSSIDALIFMTQTGDYTIPATAPILQDRLGLSTEAACFDIGLGCSGYIYALTTAAAYLNLPTINRILLLDGETLSKLVNEDDRTNAPLYGDAGTATLLDKKEGCPFISQLHTDGSGWNTINIEGGGCRTPVNEQSLKVKKRKDGSLGNDLQLYMEGVDVFNFTMRVVPKSIKDILQQSGYSLEDISYIIFHQANKFMTDFFAKKLKFPLEKVPYCLDRFGNTSSSTIPLTIVSELKDWVNEGATSDNKNVLMSGFGAGLSWATAIASLKNCHIPDLLEI